MGATTILAALIGRPILLPRELLERYPELDIACWRTGGLPPRVGGWFLGKRTVAAITLWNFVFLASDAAPNAELLLHEVRHVHQFQSSLAFPILYCWESVRRGYHRNRFEADARNWAARRVSESD